VILEGQHEDEYGDEPEDPGAGGKADPQRDIAEVERIPNKGKRAGGDQRTEAIAPGPRDDSDVVDGPESERFGREDKGHADRWKQAGGRSAGRNQKERERQRDGNRGAPPEQPGPKPRKKGSGVIFHRRRQRAAV